MEAILSSYLGQAPALLAYLLAIGVAAWLMNQYPRPAMLVIAGFGLLLVLSLVFPIVQHLIIRNLESRNYPTVFGVLAFVTSILRMVAYIALLLAAFVALVLQGSLPWVWAAFIATSPIAPVLTVLRFRHTARKLAADHMRALA